MPNVSRYSQEAANALAAQHPGATVTGPVDDPAGLGGKIWWVKWDPTKEDPTAPAKAQSDKLSGYISPFGSGVIGAGYAGDYRKLIDQLQGMANGTGPSLAAQQYKQAQGANVAAQAALSHSGRGPQAAYQAQQNIAKVGAGLAQGSADARLKERMAALGQLGSAIGSADQSDAQRSIANQSALLNLLGQQTGLSIAQMQTLMQKYQIDMSQPGWFDKFMKVLPYVAAGAATAFGGPAAGAAAYGATSQLGHTGKGTDTLAPNWDADQRGANGQLTPDL